jgi:ribonuclease HI
MATRDNRWKDTVYMLTENTKTVCLDIQKKFFREHSTYAMRAAALGSLPDGISLNKGKCIKYALAPPCFCGTVAKETTRRHWMWEGPHAPRPNLKPNNDLEDGLAARVIDLPQKPQERAEYERASTVEALKRAKTAYGNERIPTATDGSSIKNQTAAGCGIAIRGAVGLSNYQEGWRLNGADTTNWAGELDAVHILVQAANDANARIHIWIDNKGVLDQLKEYISGGCSLPKYGFLRWRKIREIVTQKPHLVSAEWVPSHGKKTHWVPSGTCGLNTNQVRDLNGLADEIAGAKSQHDSDRRGIPSYESRIKDAKQWTLLNIERLVANQKTWLLQNRFVDLANRWHTPSTQNYDE